SVIGRWLAGLVLAVLALIGVVSDASAQAVTPSVSSDEIEYHVRQGDTLSDIARRFCIDFRSIARDNRITDPNRIYAGRTVLKFKNGCSLNAPSVLEKQSVSLRELAGNSEASSGKQSFPTEADTLPLIRLARKSTRFTSADLTLIERSQVASCQMAGNQQKRWATRISDIAACIRRLHGEHIREAATQYRLSEKLIIAVMIKESEGNPNAVSSSRCLGLMQLLPSTARGYGIDLARIFDPRTNIMGGARVLRDYGASANLDRGLAAYNLGPGAVNRRMSQEGFNPSTFDYVVKVKKILSLLEG
ncbi:MAG: transglycosylase SLT domain-containing protein, partial [Candidatus Moraniibacteriota bacterium]